MKREEREKEERERERKREKEKKEREREREREKEGEKEKQNGREGGREGGGEMVSLWRLSPCPGCPGGAPPSHPAPCSLPLPGCFCQQISKSGDSNSNPRVLGEPSASEEMTGNLKWSTCRGRLSREADWAALELRVCALSTEPLRSCNSGLNKACFCAPSWLTSNRAVCLRAAQGGANVVCNEGAAF